VSGPPKVPDPTGSPEEIESKILEATNGIDYGPVFVNRVLRFLLKNSAPLFSGQTSFFVLGSYDSHPIRRLQFSETQLNERPQTYAFLLCDLLDPERFETDDDRGTEDQKVINDDTETDDEATPRDPPETHCKFYLLASYADYLIPIFEGRHAGPSVELGEIRNNFFEKTHAFRRDYDELAEDDLNNGVDPTNPYSQPQEDVLGLLDRVDRLYEWTHRGDLARELDSLPKG
jgi:hypothetical protein